MKSRLYLQLLQYGYITVLWKKGKTPNLLVQGRGEMAFLLAVTAVLYITVLWIYGLKLLLLLQVTGEMAFMPTVTAVLLHHIATDIRIECSVVSTG